MSDDLLDLILAVLKLLGTIIMIPIVWYFWVHILVFMATLAFICSIPKMMTGR